MTTTGVEFDHVVTFLRKMRETSSFESAPTGFPAFTMTLNATLVCESARVGWIALSAINTRKAMSVRRCLMSVSSSEAQLAADEHHRRFLPQLASGDDSANARRIRVREAI